MGVSIVSPKMSIPKTLKTEYVTLQGKGDLAGVTKLRILRSEDYPGLSGGVQYNHKGPYKREARKESQQ